MIPEIVKLSAEHFPHLCVNFGNSERVCFISQEVAILSSLEMNFEIWNVKNPQVKLNLESYLW